MSEANLAGPLLGGRYRLGASLGGGGMADVYRAMDTRLGRVVAVKVFRAGTDNAGRARFEEEARLLAGLNHPGLVTVHDASASGDELFLVMQLVEGETLADQIARGPMHPAQVAELGRRLADVLGYVHENGIMHRDVKPSNVLISREGEVFLADFGISRLNDAVGRMTGSAIIGTAAYMAPEQVHGADPGYAVDVYALGLVLLECVTGRAEYPGSGVETAIARLTRSPEVPDVLPEPLRSTLSAMTAAAPERRPSMAEVAASLRGDGDVTQRIAAVSAEPTVAPPRHRPGTAVYDRPLEYDRPQQYPRKRRWPLVAGLGVAAVVAGVLAILGLNAANSGQQPQLPAPAGPPGAARMAEDLANLDRLVHG